MQARHHNLRQEIAAVAAVLLLCASPALAVAVPAVPAPVPESAKVALRAVYEGRPDLQRTFASADWSALLPSVKAAGMTSLEDWARRYGYKEFPWQLADYAPVLSSPAALEPKVAAYTPVRATKTDFTYKGVTAQAVYVVDVATRKVLLARNETKPHPLASITKLMTATVALENAVSMNKIMAISDEDEVGGARLRLENGKPLTVRQIFDAMLVGSANNCAVAMSRSTSMTKQEFITAMNLRAKRSGLTSTSFVDPSGIEVENTSTARDIAALAFEAFALPDVKRATTTAKLDMVVDGQSRTIKNTNGLLTDNTNGLAVQGGKTGYLIESRWNLVVQMQDYRKRPVLVVVLGSSSQPQSFKDAAAVAKWAWANYKWTKTVATK